MSEEGSTYKLDDRVLDKRELERQLKAEIEFMSRSVVWNEEGILSLQVRLRLYQHISEDVGEAILLEDIESLQLGIAALAAETDRMRQKVELFSKYLSDNFTLIDVFRGFADKAKAKAKELEGEALISLRPGEE